MNNLRWRTMLAVLLGLLMIGAMGRSASTSTLDKYSPQSETTIQNDKLAIALLENHDQSMILEEEIKGPSELRFEALYKFASKNGVNIGRFMRYLSEYSWNTMKPLSYQDVKMILLDFSRKEGIDLESIAIKKGVDLDFSTVQEIAKVLPQKDKYQKTATIESLSVSGADYIYDYYGNSITNQIRDAATLYFENGYFVGIYASAWLTDGRVYYFTWTDYKDRFEIKAWIELYLIENYGIKPYELKLVHVKYFIQGRANWMKRFSTTVYFSNAPVQDYILFELWSEATYTYSTDSWDIHGYPDDSDAGLRRISGHPIKTLAGFAFYSQYPELSSRSFGGGSETHVSLTLYSNIWNQERLEEVGDWW